MFECWWHHKKKKTNHLKFRWLVFCFYVAATLLLGIPMGLLLGEAKASAVANRAPIPLGG